MCFQNLLKQKYLIGSLYICIIHLLKSTLSPDETFSKKKSLLGKGLTPRLSIKVHSVTLSNLRLVLQFCCATTTQANELTALCSISCPEVSVSCNFFVAVTVEQSRTDFYFSQRFQPLKKKKKEERKKEENERTAYMFISEQTKV